MAGLVIFIDALVANPTPPVSLILACLLMGLISYEQLRELVRRNGASTTVHQEGDDAEAETAMGPRVQLGKESGSKPRRRRSSS